ncbi:hypothetical protein ACFWIA_13415 [Streptomyces sp. NPDC127068]|uniref:hypothetical protein n=1 Tax=Streptomyces sp. NPDC127068 TaxID=3347127 RepID=UPI00365B6C2C
MNDSPSTGPDDGSSTPDRAAGTGGPDTGCTDGASEAPRPGATDTTDRADTTGSTDSTSRTDLMDLTHRPGDAGSGSDEFDLRALLHGSVGDLEPTDGSLDRLRRAVPARRARKRQAVVGVAAAAVLIGTAVPALVHVANSPNSTDTTVSHVGHGQQTRGSDGVESEKKTSTPSRSGSREPSGKPSRTEKGERKGGPGEPVQGATTGGATTGGGPGGATSGGDPTGSGPGTDPGTGSDNASSPSCGPTDLGSAGANVGAPGPDGSVYGSFRVANVSAGNCTVDGGGSVVVAAQGAADSTQVGSLTHTSGDAATGLPAPSSEPAQLILKPGMAYEVRFAWVPSASCPTEGGGSTGGPSPDPSTSSGTTSGAGGGGESETGGGAAPQLGGQEGVPVEGSVAVSHTAEPGAPSASTTIPDACAGTVYYTGALPAS